MANNTEVIFEDIEQRILKEIEEAHYAIFVSVAWFTNKKLFNALLEKAKGNCYVSIIIQLDDINSQCGIDYSQIQVGRSECFMISKEAELLHDKFCVIDFRKVITGSYNWTYKAAHNSENILILDDPTVATQYISRFEQQKSKYAESSVQQNATSVPTIESNDENQIVYTSEVCEVEQKTPAAKVCLHCNNEIHDNDIYCAHCGIQLKFNNRERTFKCKSCNYEQNEPLLDISQTHFCPNCGKSTSFDPKALPPIITSTIKQEHIICPACKRIIKDENYCPSCGLKRRGQRSEFSSFQQFQLCSDCNVKNAYNTNYCRNCGKDMSTHAMDKNRHGWVDLGLSVLWSTETMRFFHPWMDSKTIQFPDSNRLDIDYENDGKDIATIKWGEKWRTPTKEEFEELINNCEWEKIVIPNSQKNALKVIGPNGNHIVLPVTGYAGCSRNHFFNNEPRWDTCRFWTSTRGEDIHLAYAFTHIGYRDSDFFPVFTSKKDRERSNDLWLKTPIDKEQMIYRSIEENFKSSGCAIRPVADKKWQGHI